MNSGRTLVNGSDLYIGNSSNIPIQLGLKSDFDQCFQSVSEGKSLVAAAVTDKGVQTAADATFQQIADNIASIFQLDTSDANALASQILAGCTAYVDGIKVTGTMLNRGAVTSALNCGGSYTIPAGYHNGSGKVTANTLASQTSATAVATNILTGKTAYVNGNRLTGTMANRGAVSQALNCGGSYTIPSGYHNGSGKVTANSLASQTSATATAARILSGYTAWVNGTKLTGTLKPGISIGSAKTRANTNTLQLNSGTIKTGFLVAEVNMNSFGVRAYYSTNPSSSSMTILLSTGSVYNGNLSYAPNVTFLEDGQIFSTYNSNYTIVLFYW